MATIAAMVTMVTMVIMITMVTIVTIDTRVNDVVRVTIFPTANSMNCCGQSIKRVVVVLVGTVRRYYRSTRNLKDQSQPM